MRTRIIAAAALAAAASVTACGGSSPVPQKFIPVTEAARTYLRANPAPAVPGMTAGIVTEQVGDVAWACPHGRGSLAGSCWFWEGLLLTASGRPVTFTCGSVSANDFSPATSASCTSAATDAFANSGYVPEPGDYIYVPDSLKVTRGHDVRVIRLAALDAWDQGVPAQCDVTNWTAVHSCEYPGPDPVTGGTSAPPSSFSPAAQADGRP